MARVVRCLLAGLLAVAVALPAAALDPAAPPPRDRGDAAGVSRGMAADIARQATGGRVLGVQEGNANGGDYHVRVLTPDGTVRTLRIDRRSGRVER